MDLTGKVAVITGAASGIGRGTAVAMARRGVDIVIADVHEQRMAEAKEEVAALGRRVIAVRCDVSRNADVENLAKEALAAMGKVDILMNNAGVVHYGYPEQIPLSDWEWIVGINLYGIIRGIRAFLPPMLERGSGYIVNTSSGGGLAALNAYTMAYNTTKSAVVGLTETLYLYLKPKGIGVSLLCPGGVKTHLGETSRVVGGDTAEEFRVAKRDDRANYAEPIEVGEIVVEAVGADRFFIPTDPVSAGIMPSKAQDVQAFLDAGIARRQSKEGQE